MIEGDARAGKAGVDVAGALRMPILLGSAGFGILWFLLPIYGKQLGASALEIGGLFSVFGIVLVLLRPLVGRALDRLGRKPFIVAALLVYAASMALFSAARSVAALYLARSVQGIGSALLWIAAYTAATDLAAPQERGRTTGRVDGASAQGAFYGTFIGFLILALLPFRRGWQVLFALYAMLAAASAWLAWRQVPETRPRAATHTRANQYSFRQLYRLMLIIFVTSLSSAMLTPLLLVFLQDRFQAHVSTLAQAFIPAALIQSFLPSRAGRLSDRLGRTPLMALGLAGSGLVSLLLPRLPHLAWLIALWALEAAGLVLAAPAQEALVADLTGSEVRGAAYGLYALAASLGVVVGPPLGGWLYDTAGHGVPFYVNGAVLLCSALGVLLLLGGGANRRVTGAGQRTPG